jgi:polyhydroxyalkanoate synthase
VLRVGRMIHWMDEARRRVGRALDVLGLGPQETPHRVVAEMPGARLRAYHDQERADGPVLFIIPAPFKKAYLWDLLPEVSVVRRCLAGGLRVYLLEWLIPTRREDEFGLAEYANRLPATALDAIRAETDVSAPVLAGHSLGGTLAAIFATLSPERVGGLVLVDAPLAFGEHGGPIAHAVAVLPHARLISKTAGTPVPGSVMNVLTGAAAPHALQAQRGIDLAASLFDRRALAIHARVTRLQLDEFPLPRRLFEETVEHLYREDRFVHGTLQVGEHQTGITRLRAPVIAVINPVGGIVPPHSVLAGLEAVPDLPYQVLEYQADRGPLMQHLGPLVAPFAHEHLWPRILDWVDQHARG